MQNKQIVKITWGAIHSTKLPTGKSGPPQKVDQFFRNFSGWTEPINCLLDRNFRKFWLKDDAHEYQRCLEGRIKGFHVSLWFLKVMWPVEYQIAKKCHFFHHYCRSLHHHYSRGCHMRFYLMKQSLTLTVHHNRSVTCIYMLL